MPLSRIVALGSPGTFLKMPPQFIARPKPSPRALLRFALFAALAAMLCCAAPPGTCETLTTFVLPPTVSASALTLAGGTLYGTTMGGGGHKSGMIFKLTSAGVTALHDFSRLDGMGPAAALAAGPGGDLYGTTREGGVNGTGTIFKITPGGVFTKLHDFGVASCPTMNADGIAPRAPLVYARDGNLYGATSSGGVNATGTIFKISSGGAFSVLHVFDAMNAAGNNDDGAAVLGGLTEAGDGTLYGVASKAGVCGDGTAFTITPGGVFTVVHSFIYSDGSNPVAGLTLAPDGNFYGTTQNGGYPSYTGPTGNGTVFRMSSAGSVTTLKLFDGAAGDAPDAPLAVADDGELYGTTSTDGDNGYGTVFRLKTDGSAFATVYAFSRLQPTGLNADGAFPMTGLTYVTGASGAFYGTTGYGGASGTGTIFSIVPPAPGAQAIPIVLASFSSLTTEHLSAVGASPQNGLTLGPDGSLYGTTENGGTGQAGTVFRLTADASQPTGYARTTLYSFSRPHGSHLNADGANPLGGLVLVNGDLYGTTRYGGANGTGTIYQITLDGSITTLYDFSALDQFSHNADGAQPRAALVLGPDGALYGTASLGGFGSGTVFRCATDGTFSVLRTLDFYEGAYPRAALTLGSDGLLYGTAATGGLNSRGSLFKISIAGAFTGLYSFDNDTSLGPCIGRFGSAAGSVMAGVMHSTNVSGAQPRSALVEVEPGLFGGTASIAGSFGYGTIFQIRSDGSGFGVEHAFNGTTEGGNPDATLTVVPSAAPSPLTALVLPGGMTGGVYHKIGLCAFGGPATALSAAAGGGAACSNPDGTIYVEDGSGNVRAVAVFGKGAVLDGTSPISGLLALSDGYYYGTTPGGGQTLHGLSVAGTVFRAAVPYIDSVTITRTVKNGPGPLSLVGVTGSGFVAGSVVSVNGVAEAAAPGTPHSFVFTAALGRPRRIIVTVTAPDGTQSNTVIEPGFLIGANPQSVPDRRGVEKSGGFVYNREALRRRRF